MIRDKIKAQVNKLANDKKIDVQVAWDLFFFEEFLYRISISKYYSMFVLKGGFYLQSIVGVSSRSTMDVDLKMQGNELSENELYSILENIISMNKESEIVFKLVKIENIRAETKYGGKTVKIEATFYNVKKIFNIDIGFGDIVTPHPLTYNFPHYYRQEEFNLLAYPIETCIAEKFETVISKGITNSRSKDLFDIYLYANQKYDDLVLNAAIINTFYLRKTAYNYKYILESLKVFFSSNRIKELYENYRTKHKFAVNVSFEMCRKSLLSIFSKLKFNNNLSLSDYGVELHLVRHGQDEDNKVGGWSDNHLTSDGIAQIKTLINDIDDEYDLFISSDLNRAKESSVIINAKLNMSIIYDSNFRETNNGLLKNLTKREFDEKYHGLYYSSLKMSEKYPEGESPNDFYDRVQKSFMKLLDEHKNKKILLVTHGGVITVILCLINGFPYNNNLKITPKTSSIIKLK